MIKKIFILAVLVFIIGAVFIITQSDQTSLPVVDTSTIPATDETQYLLFGITGGVKYELPEKELGEIMRKRIDEIIERIGTTGDGTSRQLGFMLLAPPWILERGLPGKWPIVVREAFAAAREKNVAVYFSIEPHFFWGPRSDLWNDPKNIEWSDWEGTPYPARYVDWGSPMKFDAPHMCYNSPTIRAEIKRLTREFIAPPIAREVAMLKKEGKEYLFAGITIGSEPQIDNYEAVSKINPRLAKFIQADGGKLLSLGYCALTNAGYSKTNPPLDQELALAKVNQDFLAEWAKYLVGAGLSKNKLYTHVAANATDDVIKFNRAPLWIAFNEYTRPGWTTYPDGRLEKDFSAIYAELAKNGNPHWGSTEASPFNTSPSEYLEKHFAHGATVMVMNASDPMLDEKKFWSTAAITAYKQFLTGAQ